MRAILAIAALAAVALAKPHHKKPAGGPAWTAPATYQTDVIISRACPVFSPPFPRGDGFIF